MHSPPPVVLGPPTLHPRLLLGLTPPLNTPLTVWPADVHGPFWPSGNEIPCSGSFWWENSLERQFLGIGATDLTSSEEYSKVLHKRGDGGWGGGGITVRMTFS